MPLSSLFLGLWPNAIPALSAKNLAICFILYWAAWIIYSRFFHPLSKIPGPFLASFSRTWILWQVLRGDMEYTQRNLHSKHGPLIRLAPNEVACSDPEAIKIIYSTKSPLQKTDFYPPWDNKSCKYKYPVHFANIDEKLHAERRRIVNHVYSLSNVLRSEEYIDSCSSLFLKRMGEYADDGQTVDLGNWLQMYAFDVIGELYFGRMFGFMEERHDYGSLIASLDALMPVITVASTSATYARPFIFGSAMFIPAVRKALAGLDNIGKAAKGSVARRASDLIAGSRTRQDLLQQMFDIYHEKGEKLDFGIGDMEQEAGTAIFAGSDTTAIAMRAVFYFLLNNPESYQRLLSELDDAADSGQLSSPVKYAEAIRLPYLCACIKEAMRLHPSVGFTMPRVVPEGGLELCGQFIPAGYRVGINDAVVHYDKNIFGDDAASFRPERWIEGDASMMDRYMIHFGAGTRTCIGKNISLSELHKLIPQVLRHLTLELADPTKKWKTSNRWFNKQTGLMVRLKRC